MPKPTTKRFTHRQRAVRRERIAAAVRAGASIAEVVARFKVSGTMARRTCRELGVPPRGRLEAARRAQARYRAIARAAGQGATSTRLMERFGVSRKTVYEACDRQGVELTSARPTTSPRTLKIAREIRKGREPMTAIARKFGVSRQRVSQIAQLAAERGF